MMEQVIGWATVSPEFGAAMQHGSCTAITVQDVRQVCGYPLREDGTCTNGHPARPAGA